MSGVQRWVENKESYEKEELLKKRWKVYGRTMSKCTWSGGRLETENPIIN